MKRGYLKEYLGNNKAVFVCKLGHEFTGPVVKKSRGVTEAGIKLLVRWWSRENGGCLVGCQKCKEMRKGFRRIGK